MQTDPKPIPQVLAALCGLHPGLTFRVLVGGTMQTCATMPTPAETGKVWALVAGTQIMALPLFGPEGVMDTGMLLLDSPLALCHAARWLAQQRGHPPVATAPEWSLEESDGTPCWRLRSGDKADWFPTIDAGLPPAEALAAACVAAGGAPA